jgi:predicted naringenin-chalcone synthase
VDLVVSTTVTGIAVPSLDARIAVRIGMRPDVKRIPIIGLGCLAGADRVARLHDFPHGRPTSVAMLASVDHVLRCLLLLIMCRSKSRRCRSSGMSVFVDEAAEDAGAEQSASVEVVHRGGMFLRLGW